MFPPLAVVAVVSMYSITYFEQFAIARLLVESKALKYAWYEERIVKECEYIAGSWFDTLKIILPFAGFSYGYVVFDTLGDKYGWEIAIGPSLSVFLLPLCYYLWKNWSMLFTSNSDNDVHSCSNAVEIEMALNRSHVDDGDCVVANPMNDRK